MFVTRFGLVLATFCLAAPLTAQDPKPWQVEGELGASLFFGASSQAAVLFRSGYTLESETLEFNAHGSFDYGEAQEEGGPSFVNKRSWSLGTELDYEVGSWAPFVFVSGEGSLRRKLDLRIEGGAGTRYRFIDSAQTRFDISVGVLAERTDPRETPAEVDAPDTLARLSNRVRFSRRFGGKRALFNLVTFYKPSLDDASRDYTLDVESALSFALNGTVSLKVSLVDQYDALATARGAGVNNDGRLFFSILAKK
ncbi:MAG: DUF481 domain-containing protein [Gemmatimonadales bacterium]|nr:MAG: DUF481 domain-containing protein [Gemmatimonadales bacterium]